MREKFDQIFLRLLYWLIDRISPAQEYTAVRVADRPNVPKPGVIYVIGNGEHIWEASMRCPEGCGHQLSMNLQPDIKPNWRLIEHNDGSISLSPSVWRKQGCGCHFFLKRGKVRHVS